MTTAPLVDCAYLHSAFGPGCPYCWQPAIRGDQKQRRTRGWAAGEPDRPGEGGRLRYLAAARPSAEEGATRLDIVPTAAAGAARDPAAREYTSWGSAGMSATDAEGEPHTARRTTRFVVGLASPDPDGQREEISALADRPKLR